MLWRQFASGVEPKGTKVRKGGGLNTVSVAEAQRFEALPEVGGSGRIGSSCRVDSVYAPRCQIKLSSAYEASPISNVPESHTMKRNSTRVCAGASSLSVLVAMIVAVHHPPQESLDDRGNANIRRNGYDLQAAYTGRSLSHLITSGWVIVDSADDILVPPPVPWSLPPHNWKDIVGNSPVTLRMNDGCGESEFVSLDLSHAASANEIKHACENTLAGEQSLADVWTVERIRVWSQDH